jgi:hypothetical protein
MREAFFTHVYSRNLQVLLPNASDDELCEMWYAYGGSES